MNELEPIQDISQMSRPLNNLGLVECSNPECDNLGYVVEDPAMVDLWGKPATISLCDDCFDLRSSGHL